MSDKTISVRVRFEGGDQVKAGLQEIGREGTRSLTNLGNVSRQTGAQLQNAGYQVSDFFVQVQGGTAPTRALAQQLPQLLQGFGLIGVAASVAIAALPALWSLFGNGADESEALNKHLQEVTKSIDEYGKAADLATEPMDKLIKKYGELAGAVRDARMQEAELARGRAVRSVNSILDTGNFNAGDTQSLQALQATKLDFRAPSAEMQRLAEAASEASYNVSEIARQSGLSTEQVTNLAIAANRVRESTNQGAAEQVAAASALRDYLVEVYGSADAANQATGGLVDSLNAAVTAAADVAAVDMASPIGAAAGEAARLASNLFDAAAAQRQFDRGNKAYGGRGADPRLFDGKGPQAFNPSADVIKAADAMLNPRPRGGGGGGGGGGVDSDIARAKALTEGVRTETEKYAIALEEVNRLKQKGLITDETYNRQIDKLNDKLGETGDLGKKAASAIRSAFDGLFDDPQQDLKDLAKQLAMMALYQGLAKGFPSVFGEDGFLSLGVPGFAAGGRHRGGLRIVGENGPELEATGPSMIYPTDALARMGRGGGGAMKVEINNFGSGQVTAEQRRGPNGEQVLRVMVSKDLASGAHDSAMRSRYGAPPNRVKR